MSGQTQSESDCGLVCWDISVCAIQKENLHLQYQSKVWTLSFWLLGNQVLSEKMPAICVWSFLSHFLDSLGSQQPKFSASEIQIVLPASWVGLWQANTFWKSREQVVSCAVMETLWWSCSPSHILSAEAINGASWKKFWLSLDFGATADGNIEMIHCTKTPQLLSPNVRYKYLFSICPKRDLLNF